ncbi:MAG: hypothetical protein VX438_05285, partial [Planctomycetota bacterium]|nr:hypothetical protein [Planctomycetota bacterium]
MPQSFLTKSSKSAANQPKAAIFKPFARLQDWLWREDYCETQDVLQRKKIDWLRAIPFILIHLGCIAVFWVDISSTAVVVGTLL